MVLKIGIFLLLFILGEFLVNVTIFSYVKKYFTTNNIVNQEKGKPFLGLSISTCKGILERLTLYLGLSLALSQILIVYGTLKIGSRLAGSKKVENDYFIVGNFISIIIGIGYYYAYTKIINCNCFV